MAGGGRLQPGRSAWKCRRGQRDHRHRPGRGRPAPRGPRRAGPAVPGPDRAGPDGAGRLMVRRGPHGRLPRTRRQLGAGRTRPPRRARRGPAGQHHGLCGRPDRGRLPGRDRGPGGGGAVKFSVRVNNDLGFSELLTLATAAEQAGFDQLWVSNDLFLRSAPVLVGALATGTARIGLGIAVMNPYSVHVSELAMLAATMQEVSGGRFLLGLGAGSEQFLGWAGLARPQPLATTRAALVSLRALLGHEDVDRALLPEWFGPQSVLRFPLARPVPVYIGAMGPKMLEMAGRHADGVLPLLYPPERYASVGRQVLAGAADGHRDVDLPACFWVSLSDDPVTARTALAEKLAYYGPSISVPVLGAAGPRPPA